MVTPHCNVHGPMKYRATRHWWVCAGFDGEGCQIVNQELIEACVTDPPGLTLVRT